MTVIFRGKPACECLREWIPVYEQELQELGILKGELNIFQLNGTAPESAGTHTGGAADFIDLPGGDEVLIAREMGAPATWTRPFNWNGKNGIAHNHSILRGCPHNFGGRYQITAVEDGFNGLGTGGRGGPDTGPRPVSPRTWQEGIAWARRQQKRRRQEAKLAAARIRRRKISAFIRKLEKKLKGV